MPGKTEGRRRRGRQRMRWLDGIPDLMTWVWASSGSWWWTGKPGVLQSMGSQRVGHDWATELKCTLISSIDRLPSLIKHFKSILSLHLHNSSELGTSGTLINTKDHQSPEGSRNLPKSHISKEQSLDSYSPSLISEPSFTHLPIVQVHPIHFFQHLRWNQFIRKARR